MNRRKMLALVISVFLVAATACSSSSSAPAPAAPAPSAAPAAQSAAPAPAPAQKFTLKLAHVSHPDSPEGRANQHFADLVAERSGGNIEVLVYPSEQLGKPAVAFEGTSMGTIDITIVGCPDLGFMNPYFNVCNIPYLYNNREQYQSVVRDIVGESQNKTITDNDLVLLSTDRTFFRGPYRVLASKRPVKSPGDLEGLRFRTFDSKVYMTAYQLLKANPIVISWSEVYMGLLQGTVEAASCNMGDLYTSGITEVAKYVAVTEEYYSEVVWVMNEAKFGSMPADYQQLLIDTCNETAGYFQELMIEQSNEERKTMEDQGVEFYEFSDADRAAFQTVLKDLNYYHDLEKDGTMPEGMVDKVLAMK